MHTEQHNSACECSLATGAHVSRRAALHGALSDPARLQIVDWLTLGDRSPRELEAALGMPSNLLAHHLSVLERQGLLTRHRSEADRRRSYLRLVPETLEELQPQHSVPVVRVVFVCTANSARSQLAAALWSKTSVVPAASGGTHPAPAIAPGAVAAARRHGLRLARTKPRQVADIVTSHDFVITVCDNAHEELGPASGPGDRRLHWSVADPVRSDNDDAFDTAYYDLASRVARVAPRLIPSSTAS
jgi:protein-tyrosine-phosphatase/DNA-binding transcriptional ArsR family regulator